MNCSKEDSERSAPLESLAAEIYGTLSRRFPVCFSSDEFHFFPQFRPDSPDWSRWDNFSSGSVKETTNQISGWEAIIRGGNERDSSLSHKIDCEMLARSLSILREQMAHGEVHKQQPTFYLTIAGIGLAEAMEAGGDALVRRIETFPGFIEIAIENLACVPELFRDMGRDMIREMASWLKSLSVADTDLLPALSAMERFDRYLLQIPVADDFHLPKTLYAHIARHHMGCRMDLEEIAHDLDREISENRTLMDLHARKVSSDGKWQTALTKIRPPMHPNGIMDTYRDTIDRLRRHCVEQGLVSQDLAESCPAAVEHIPDYLLPVRSNAAFSMPPGHPPRGGTFYIMPGEDHSQLPIDYRLLSAHETFPGHHLLDMSRWMLKRALRRPLEYPLFYEGWASFSEELLFETGYFKGPIDGLLLARRRFLRAIRGRVDLDIHTGACSLSQGAARLTESGVPKADAQRMVRRYALKPGYQLSYAMGTRNFRRLYRKFAHSGKGPADFASRIMKEGEIGFDHLAQIL